MPEASKGAQTVQWTVALRRPKRSGDGVGSPLWLRSRHRWNSKQCSLWDKLPDLQKSACLLEGRLPPKTPDSKFAKDCKKMPAENPQKND